VFFCFLLDVTYLLGYLLEAVFVVCVLDLELWSNMVRWKLYKESFII